MEYISIFSKFILDYICPFLNVSFDDNNYEIDIRYSNGNRSVDYESKSNQLLFWSCLRKGDITVILLNYNKNPDIAYLREIISYFISNINNLDKIEDSDILDKALELLFQKGLCRWFHRNHYELINRLINKLSYWENQTNEGEKIDYCIGIKDCFNKGPKVNFLEFVDNKYSSVFSNQYNSIIQIDKEGNLIDNFFLNSGQTLTGDIDNPSFLQMPSVFAPIIALSERKGSFITFILTKQGDLLVFKRKRIIAIKRKGNWQVINFSIFAGSLVNVRCNDNKIFNMNQLKIFNSILNISISYVGGCLGFVSHEKILGELDMLINPIDRLDIIETDQQLNSKCQLPIADFKKKIKKRKVLLKLINGKKFYELPSLLLIELLQLDGALILDENSNIITAGCILQKITIGSCGGGRSAAALQLSLYGVGIKISEDGDITVNDNTVKVYCLK